MSTKAVYDDIAQDYKESKQLPFRIHIERHMIFDLLGDLSGKSVLDLACGEGIYSRQVMAAGAMSVTGVDISSEMIALAEAEEKRKPQGNLYVVGDAAHYKSPKPFDRVLCSYFLNYAKTWDEIQTYCRAIYDNLKPGGKFVGFNDNPANDPADYGRYRKFGFYKTTPENRKEGAPITYHILNSHGGEFKFDNFYLSKETYEKAFQAVGFKDFQWHQPRLSKEGAEKFEPGFWDDFLKYPPMIGISAKK